MNFAYAGSSHAKSSILQTLGSLAPLALIMLIFYFLVIRPQQRKANEHKMMINNLRKGDKVVTAGGIIGTVFKIDQGGDTLIADIAPETRVRLLKNTITEVINDK